MLLLSNMVLNTGAVAFFRSFAIFSSFSTCKYCGLIFCFAKPLTRKCSVKILRLQVAKLQLNFGILSQNCTWIFLLISSPVKSCTNTHNSSICQLRLYPCSRNLTLINKFDAKLLLFHILTNASSQFL